MSPPFDASTSKSSGPTPTSEIKARGANRSTKVAGKLKVLPEQPEPEVLLPPTRLVVPPKRRVVEDATGATGDSEDADADEEDDEEELEEEPEEIEVSTSFAASSLVYNSPE